MYEGGDTITSWMHAYGKLGETVSKWLNTNDIVDGQNVQLFDFYQVN
jgi:hypothetical protein